MLYNRLMSYNWQYKDWLKFSDDLSSLEASLLLFSERMGRTSGLLEGLSEDDQTASVIDMMVAEAVKTSEIEGEMISRRDVMSSIKNNLGLNPTPEHVQDRRADGVAELMLDVRDSFAEPLSEDKLFAWHRMLMKGVTCHFYANGGSVW
jgi:Fic family protein